MTATPPIVDRETWQKQIDTQRVRERAHTRGDAIAEARWLIDTFKEPVAAVCVGARRRVSRRV
jgi:hypothetical protein